MHRFAITLAAAALTATASAQFTLVTPSGYAAAEGATNNSFPWNRGTASTRIQFLIDSSHFTSQGVTYPIVISQLRYRADAAPATTIWAGGSWPQVRIDLASATVDALTPSATFASNLGPDLATVLNGPVTVVGGAGNGAGIPGPWYITIPLTANFVYDPTLGADLVVDIYQDGTGWTGASRTADHVQSTGVPPPIGSRVYNTAAGALTATTGTITSGYGAVTEFSYVPATGLFASFSANVTGGATPLAVQFTDNSFSSAPGGVTSWAWDFDGDLVIDSNAQNPSHVYTTCGSYNVSLTVGDGVNPPSTLTLPNFIRTDLITADFTHQVIGPLTVQFTDTSNMPATSWAWDFDGDTIIDSILQNPTFVFPSATPFNTTLTVTRLCSPGSSVTKQVVAAQQITTNLAANNGGASLWTVYYNLDVLNPLGVSIAAFDSISSSVSTAFTVDTYLKLGTHVGFEYNPAPWTLVATASGTSNAVANQPSNAVYPLPLHIPQGSYGVALRYIGIVPRYVTLTATTPVGNGDMVLTLGSAAATTVGPFTGTTTTVNTPRMWSGTLYYETTNVTGSAGYGWFGPGCPGTLGVTSTVATTEPTIGGTLQTNLDNLQLGVAVMIIGVSNTFSGAIPLPLDLGVLGAPGCPLRVSLDATQTVVGAGTTANWSFAIPNVASLLGAQLYNQAAPLDSINVLGLVTGHAYGWVVGN